MKSNWHEYRNRQPQLPAASLNHIGVDGELQAKVCSKVRPMRRAADRVRLLYCRPIGHQGLLLHPWRM